MVVGYNIDHDFHCHSSRYYHRILDNSVVHSQNDNPHLVGIPVLAHLLLSLAHRLRLPIAHTHTMYDLVQTALVSWVLLGRIAAVDMYPAHSYSVAAAAAVAVFVAAAVAVVVAVAVDMVSTFFEVVFARSAG